MEKRIPKPTMVACSNCNERYDYNEKSVMCPHKEFPKPCKDHDKIHCGFPQCLDKVLVFRKREEVA
jgi:hypothetical protein